MVKALIKNAGVITMKNCLVRADVLLENDVGAIVEIENSDIQTHRSSETSTGQQSHSGFWNFLNGTTALTGTLSGMVGLFQSVKELLPK